ncbi:Fe-S protein assembly co-chaperone HscB [Thauera linaloolentis]|uniref:Co-chaperone protein HscB homolog n=1 Tax=Thauera linaloolentis (strain DSM 12138 / JCM 21573 / CCUG 41526 / CIP 105981 / IAM 15112 / NBRC 102519 / 47Lol) TaxID=1123367 RepID=N6YFI0_THAL4|nr:Fe-S protein assembly co-chaperone HscB [Thauera linaloolentis]ENO90270.1 co-chaperone HscB [Thauera linaloolentis 47Lol = DSM 12138]MCM8566240.1 Fe-S protein assembly co-chaperone HscB [Thauera linaloolentis]
MSIDPTQDYFSLFGLQRTYAMDEAVLEAAWHRLQSQVHPDRYAHLPDVDKRRAMQWATRVNEGFRTLKKPLARARYLLELAGVDVGVETNTAMSPEFLMEQMEWREAVEEARAAAEVEELEQLHVRLLHHARDVRAELGRQIDVDHDLAGAADTVRRLMFIEKLQHEIDEALLALEG